MGFPQSVKLDKKNIQQSDGSDHRKRCVLGARSARPQESSIHLGLPEAASCGYQDGRVSGIGVYLLESDRQL